jgi:hypothetical protein
VDEYGFPSEPKFSHLASLHKILFEFSDLFLDYNVKVMSLGKDLTAFTFGNFETDEQSVVFLLNHAATGEDASTEYMGFWYKLPRWSITIVQGPSNRPTIRYNTAKILYPATKHVFTPATTLDGKPVSFDVDCISEKPGVWDEHATAFNTVPKEHISMTRDKTDYLWHELRNVKLPNGVSVVNVTLTNVQDYV